MKSISGDGAPVKFIRERGVTNNKQWIKEINPDTDVNEYATKKFAFSGELESIERSGGAGTTYFKYDGRRNLNGIVDGEGIKQAVSYDYENFNQPSVTGIPLTGGDELDLNKDFKCSKREYAYTPEGLKTTFLSYPYDNSDEPFEDGYVQVSPDGSSGTFAIKSREGSFSCDNPPSTGTYKKTVTFEGKVETFTYEKYLLKKNTLKNSINERTVTTIYTYDGLKRIHTVTNNKNGHKEKTTIGYAPDGLIESISSTAKGKTVFVRNGDKELWQIINTNGVTSVTWQENGLLKSTQHNDGPKYLCGNDALGRDSTITREQGVTSSTVEHLRGNDGCITEKKRDGVSQFTVNSRYANGSIHTASFFDGITLTKNYDNIGLPTNDQWADPTNSAANLTFYTTWTRDGRLRTHGQLGGPQTSNFVGRINNNRIQYTTEYFSGVGITNSSVTTSLNGVGGRPDMVRTEIAGFANMDLSSFATYSNIGHLNSVTGELFEASFQSANSGLTTNTIIKINGSSLLTRSVIWSASVGKPARVDYTLNGQFLRRWQYAFKNGRVKKVIRSGGSPIQTDYTYDGRGYLLDAKSKHPSGLECDNLSFSYLYNASGDTIQFGGVGLLSNIVLSASQDLQKEREYSRHINVVGRISDDAATVQVTHAGVTATATVAEGLFYASLPVQSLNSTVCTSGVATVTATPSVGPPQTKTITFSLPVHKETPVYNDRGMIISDSRRSYVWDAVGRLMSIDNNGVTPAVHSEYSYYADGRRAKKSISKYIGGSWQLQRTLQYAWRGWKLSAECERDASETITAVRSFIWGPDIQGQQNASLDSGAEGIGGLLAIREWKPATGQKIYLPLTDGLGNICGLIDSDTATLVAEYEYDPYGNLIMEHGTAIASCPFRHRTRYYDDENWLYYYGYRYYDPNTTKWISKDPLGETGGWNLTSYCNNDPINKFDPTGLEPGSPWAMDQGNAARQKGEQYDPVKYTRTWNDEFVREIMQDPAERRGFMVGSVVFIGVPALISSGVPMAIWAKGTEAWYKGTAALSKLASIPKVAKALPWVWGSLETADWVVDPALNMSMSQAEGGVPVPGDVILTKIWKGADNYIDEIFSTSKYLDNLHVAPKTITGAGDDAGRYLYHYTNPKSTDNILAKGFDTRYSSDGALYFTDKGSLSPLQAQIELALPANRPLPDSLLRIDVGALEKAGISPFLGPRRVQGNLNGLGAGGGTELLFNQNIPKQFIQKVR